MLASVSAIALLAASPDATARSLGGKSPSPSAAAIAAAQSGQLEAARIARQSQNALKRATLSIQAMQATQQAARDAARAQLNAMPSIRNGMGPGGLVVDPRVATNPNLWVNAGAPTPDADNANNITIKQTGQRAILTWKEFNVGADTTLYYDQTGGNSANGNSWVALNRIDASGRPSQILGQIKAEGTVLLINPNGIIFTGTSQINVHSLIASSMDLNSYANAGAANVGVLNASGAYAQISVDGVLQTSGGNALLAPVNEANGNEAFLKGGLFVNGAGSTTPGTLVFSAGNAGPNAGIRVDAGAVISTADKVSGFDNGGLVALVGPKVVNAGSIETSAGQIILASGSSVFLTEPAAGSTQTSFTVANAAPINTPLAYTPSPIVGGSAAINASETLTLGDGTTLSVHGLLTSRRGAITMVGDTVEQLGGVAVTTSITRAGSITLVATGTPSAGNRNLGLVRFGSDSITSILPEENGETIPSDAASLSSFVAPSISVTMANMDMASGSLILAPGAAMSVATYAAPGVTGALDPAGRVLLEAGSEINLAGLTGVTRSVSDYLYTFKVTANDVADTPLAKSLIGQTVTIDLSLTGTRTDGETWVGSPLFASSGAGYLANIAQGIDQLLTKGGSLTVGNSTGVADVVTAPGSVVNVSGGWIEYTGARISTTRVLGADGRSYDIGSADPAMAYVTVDAGFTRTNAHWGVTETWRNPLGKMQGYAKAGYINGLSAGGLNVTAVNPVLEGKLVGDIVAGMHQIALGQVATGANGTQLTSDQLPSGATLAITIKANDSSGTSHAVRLVADAPDLIGEGFTLSSPLVLPGGVLTYSTTALSAENLGSITIKGASDVILAEGASLSVRDGGKIALTGVSSIDGTLTAHAGSIALSGFVHDNPNLQPQVAALTIGEHALLDVSGLWINDTGLDSRPYQGAAYINGGSVTISTDRVSQVVSFTPSASGSFYDITAKDVTQSIVLAAGSVVDVSSGGYIGANGKLKTGSNGLPAGDGGSLSLLTYVTNGSTYGQWGSNRNQENWNNNNVAPVSANAASVTLGGTIYAGGLNKGGTFALQAPAVTIDGNATGVVTDAATGTVTLPTDFFNQGFSSYKLTSTYGSTQVAAGTALSLKQQNYLLAGASLPATGAHVRDFASLGLALDGMRAPVNLTLEQSAFYYGRSGDASTTAGVVIGEGASILADPAAAITATAEGSITMLGSIVAPGGSISLASTAPTGQNAGLYKAAPVVWIGADAKLDVSGVYVPDPTEVFNTGKVLDGGTIAISGAGAIVALTGSEFNLKGASATVEMPVGGLSKSLATREIWSDGGTLTLSSTSLGAANSSLYFGGTIDAEGGAPLASGGRLNVGTLTINADSVGNPTYNTEGYSTILLAPNGDVTAALASASAPRTAAEFAALGLASGTAFINASTINTAKLDSLSLTGNTLAFAGDVGLNVPGALYLNGNIALLPSGATSLAAATPSVGSTVNLNAGYIRWLSGLPTVPVAGGGTLNLNARAQIDLAGIVSASYANTVNLSVSGGDIRFLPTSATDIAGYLRDIRYSTSTDEVFTTTGGGLPSAGALLVSGDLTMTAREVYPATNTAFLLMSLGLGGTDGGTIAFKSNGQSTYTPYSAGGAILVDAKKIRQAGALYAPLGTVQLGYSAGQSLPAFLIGTAADTGSNSYDPVSTTAANPFISGTLNPILSALISKTGKSTATVTTDSVTLVSGSITSTSAVGVMVPYGTTTDGEKWTAGGIELSGPPAKLVVLAGNAVTTQSGAVIDQSGGGDIYATEFVPGTGGSRNVLATPDTYALVPSYQVPVAAYDATSGGTVPLGMSVTLPGGNGIEAGTYVLMPAQYATMPGAYRVALVNADTGRRGSFSTVTADGSVYMTGVLGNAITGAKSSATAVLQIQPNSTWTRYSQIDIAYGNDTFAGNATRLARDAGQLVVAATSALNLAATNKFAPAAGGRGGQVDITGDNLLVVASDLKASFTGNGAYNGFIMLDAGQISSLGVESVLLGGTRSNSSDGVLINATAKTLEVATDAANPLSGSELLLVTKAGRSGLVIDQGSVIAANGTVSSASADALVIGADGGASGDGGLLRLSNGGLVAISRNNAAAAAGRLTVGANVTLTGNSLTLDSSGSTTIADTATLISKNYDLAGAVINVGGGSGGLVVNDTLIAKLAGANAVSLRSASMFNFHGGLALGTAANRIGTLTLDGSGFANDGGPTTITAGNIVIKNSRGTANTAGAIGGSGGTLAFDASDTLTFGAGTKSAAGFASVSATAGKQMLFSGNGSFDAAGAAVTLTSPFVVVDTAASQSLTTTGVLALQPGAEHTLALAADVIGGSLTLTGGSIADAGTIIAQSGKVTLKATTGDLALSGNAAISATGTAIPLHDVVQFTPGGTVKLIADAGNVTLEGGTLIDVSAAGAGYAGGLGIKATNGTATLAGTLKGGAASNDKGGSFLLSAEALSGSLPLSAGFTSNFQVALGTGDITIAAGQTLTSQNVLLQADGGWVNVLGSIDASGRAGGSIGLYGTKGVDVEGSLLARASASDELGGSITLGTSGTPTDGSYNPDYGYENVAAGNSGSIVIGANAVLDVSGGTKGGLSGGTIHIRAPLLDDGSVKVAVAPTATFRGARAKTLEAYAVWSTTDATTGAHHFDGVIDPAGWYDASGNLVSGSFTDANGNTVLTYTAGSMTADQLKTWLANYYFTPDNANAAHQTFYGYANGAESPGTLMGFVQHGLAGTPAASGFTLVPGIDLRNPSTGANSGNITVATNWNLGAQNSSGDRVYRFNDNAPNLTLRAANNVNINASITDGFTSSYALGYTTTVLGNSYGSVAETETAYWAYYYSDYSSIISSVRSDMNGLLFDASGAAITSPVVVSASSDVYYYLYYGYADSYVSLYSYYAASNLSLVRDYADYFASEANGGITLAAAAANPSDSSQGYAASALSYLAAAQSYYAKISSDGTATEKLNNYKSYLDNYRGYIYAYNNWLNTEGNGYLGSLPEAPLAPPPVSVAAGSVTVATIDNSPSPVAGIGNKSPISVMNLASAASSTSYRIAAGANLLSANPVAVTPGSGADVVIDGHTSYTNPQYTSSNGLKQTIDIPTLVRTGAGSIAIAAPGDFVLADTVAPGAVYTAGFAADTPAGFAAPAVPEGYTGNPNGLVSTPTWAQGGGSVTVDVGGDIVGVETAALTGVSSWASWYYHAIASNGTSVPFSSPGNQQTAAWINYATYWDGIGALGGGNVTLRAGGAIKDLVVSLPEGIAVAGGTSSMPVTTKYTYGGGNLAVTAGDIAGSAFLVGEGTGTIRVAGSVTKDTAGNGLELAVQNGTINVIAGGDVMLAGLYDPAMLSNWISRSSGQPGTAYTLLGAMPGVTTLGWEQDGYFTSYGQDSGVSLTSVTGDVAIVTAASGNHYLPAAVAGNSFSTILAPATLSLNAIAGDITTSGGYPSGAGISLIPSAFGTLSLLAGGDIKFIDTSGGTTSGNNYTVTMLDGAWQYYVNPLGTPTPTTLSEADHIHDAGSVSIYAGGDLYGTYDLSKQARLHAGRDIINVKFTGQNNRASDVTSVIAGRDILSRIVAYNGLGREVGGASTFVLYGPGDFLVEAGRNLGPFSLGSGGGIFTVGDGSNCTASICNNVVKPYLPIAGANITTLFGTGRGMDVAAAIANYVDPAKAGTDGISYLPDIAAQLGVSEDEAWAAFQALPPAKKKLVLERAFLDFLTQVSRDYNDASSPYSGQYARAYQSTAMLFPATLGYTDNSGGGSGATPVRKHTGDLKMARSLIETQTGGDINIIGPGGNAYVGSNSADNLSPTQQGILTLQGGSVRSYTDGDVQIYQSRIFTQQGGNVELFSANGDLNAGKGPKSAAAYPPLRLVCDEGGYCRVSPAALVTGAGVGALLSVAGQDPAKSNVVLSAPRGTVDFGAAGVRSANDLNILANRVLNSFNADIGGVTTGVPTIQAPNIGGLTEAGNTAGAAAQAAGTPNQNRASEQPSVIIVEVIGFGGGDDSTPSDDERRRRDRRSYNTDSPFRIVGGGTMNAAANQYLTEEEKREFLRQQSAGQTRGR